MLITPDIIMQLAPLEMKARQIVEGFMTGIHKSPFYGYSVEFAEHRPYNHGDEMRHVDWKVYGKSERYYVKQYEEETNLRCYILLDISPSMLFRYYSQYSKLNYGIHQAAAIIHLMHRQRDAVGTFFFDDEIRDYLPARSNRPHIQLIYKKLEELLSQTETIKRKTATAEIIHEVAERIHKRSLVVIISDLFENVKQHDDLIGSLKHLRHRHHDVILFNLLEKRSERDFDLPDKKFVLSDMETGRNLDVLPVKIKKIYQEKMGRYLTKFKTVCRENNIDFEEIDIEKPFDVALLAYLNKRRKFV